MSGTPAEQSESFASTASRLDAILDQLNALGGSSSSVETPRPALHSVPDLAPEDPAEHPAETVDPASLQPPVVPSIDPLPELPPSLGVITPTSDAVVEPPPLPVEIEPVVDEVPVPDLADSLPEVAPSALVEPPPIVVEYHEPAEEEHVLESASGDDLDRQELVFELDGPLDVEPQVSTALDAAETTPTPPPVPDDIDPGWVSHHIEHVDEGELALSSDTTLPGSDELTDHGSTEPTFDAPQWAEINENPHLENPHIEAEKALGTPFSPVVGEAAETQVAAPVEPEQSETLGFETDDDLPLPDFTGVGEDSSEPTVWDTDMSGEDSVPEPVEHQRSGSGIAVGRNELDSLRPTEEAKAVSKPEQSLGRKLQLVGVVLFGLITLAVIFLDDPAVVEELRELYDGFFG